ncbi:MAG: aldo/keto reductase, partial [Clostridia bacterium]|nr:aldo/keto reductase [Clostridia bacterium]
ETVEYCNKNGILIEAWAPLGRAQIFENETIASIAKKHNKTSAQICLRWCIQHNAVPIPKSVTPSRILENTDIFDFVLDEADMKEIDALPFIGGSAHDPDTVNF